MKTSNLLNSGGVPVSDGGVQKGGEDGGGGFKWGGVEALERVGSLAWRRAWWPEETPAW
jgi:hypothetical protein